MSHTQTNTTYKIQDGERAPPHVVSPEVSSDQGMPYIEENIFTVHTR